MKQLLVLSTLFLVCLTAQAQDSTSELYTRVDRLNEIAAELYQKASTLDEYQRSQAATKLGSVAEIVSTRANSLTHIADLQKAASLSNEAKVEKFVLGRMDKIARRQLSQYEASDRLIKAILDAEPSSSSRETIKEAQRMLIMTNQDLVEVMQHEYLQQE